MVVCGVGERRAWPAPFLVLESLIVLAGDAIFSVPLDYRAGATLARREPERRFLLRRLTEVGG